MNASVNPAAITETFERIRGHVRETPIVAVDGADFGSGPRGLLPKLEHLQPSGSSKGRGAFANLLWGRTPPAGVTAASGGNHGVAVAFAARALGVRAKIFLPTVASPAKIARIRGY